MKKLILIGILCLSSSAMAETKIQNMNRMPVVNTPMAKVIESVPVYQEEKTSFGNCSTDTYQGLGSLFGAIVGGTIGAQYNAALAVTGTILGAGVGAEIAKPSKAERQACAPHQKTYSIIGYDVKYVYNNQMYIQRLDYDPGVGSFLRASISVTR
jgi:uncharacterized protein YcfJ